MAVHFNVGGIRYSTSVSTIMKHPKSKLAILIENEKHIVQEGKEIFIDRNGSTFKYILEYYRNGNEMILPENQETLRELMQEAKYFKLLSTLEEFILENRGALLKFKAGDCVHFHYPYEFTTEQVPEITSKIMDNCEHEDVILYGWWDFLMWRQDAYIGMVLDVNQKCVIVKFTTRLALNSQEKTTAILHVPEMFLKKA